MIPEKLLAFMLDVDNMDPADLKSKLLKLVEEVGEISADTLALDGYKYSEKSPEALFQNSKEEAIDIFIMILTIMKNNFQMSNEEIKDIFYKKTMEWQEKILKKRSKKNEQRQ